MLGNFSRLPRRLKPVILVLPGPKVNAKAFEVQIKNGTGGWLLGGVFAYSRGIILPGLTSGQSYSVQTRAIGGSTGQSPWSDEVTRVVT